MKLSIFQETFLLYAVFNSVHRQIARSAGNVGSL